MNTEVLSPLAEIIKRASQSSVEGPASKMKARYESASEEVVILVDCSGSMSDLIGNSQLTKAQHMAIALRDVLTGHRSIRLMTFNTGAQEITDVPGWLDLLERQLAGQPTGFPQIISGGTDLAAGLTLASTIKPRKTVVISDGLPNDEPRALKVADLMTGRIDTIYCGPDQHPAIDFLRKLARSTGGVQVTWDGYRSEISSAIRGLLSA